MGTATINGELWGARAQNWSNIQEGQVVPVYEAVFDAAGVTSGTTMLDAACGSGLAVQLAGKRGATVAGLDASAALIAVARDRSPGADLRVGELEELPYGDGTFDVATSFNGVQYAGNAAAALTELARVLRPGGLVAVVTWGQPDACEIMNVLTELGPLMPPPPPGPAHGGPFSLSAPGLLETFLETAGLTPVETREVTSDWAYPDLDTAVLGNVSPGVMEMVARHAGEAAMQASVRRGLLPFVRPDGTVHLSNSFRYIIGRAQDAR